jgi:hypothetical protein
LLAVGLLGLLAVMRSGSSLPDFPRDGAEAVPAVGTVGDTRMAGDLAVTLHGVTDPAPAPELTRSSCEEFPDNCSLIDGDRLVAVDVEVANQGDDSVFIGWELKDAQNFSFGWDAGIGDDYPDNDQLAGQAERGTLYFQVPEGATGLRLEVSTGRAVAVFALP